MDINWRTDRTSVVAYTTAVEKPDIKRTGDRWMIKTSIDIFLSSRTGIVKLRAVDMDLPERDDFGACCDMSDDIFVILRADTVGFNIFDSEAANWQDEDFDEDANAATIAELRKNSKTLLNHEPVFRSVCALFS